MDKARVPYSIERGIGSHEATINFPPTRTKAEWRRGIAWIDPIPYNISDLICLEIDEMPLHGDVVRVAPWLPGAVALSDPRYFNDTSSGLAAELARPARNF